jgi:hypothetical protein
MSTATQTSTRHFALVGTPNSGKTALFADRRKAEGCKLSGRDR